MAKTLDEMMKQLPSSRRSKIEARAKELIDEQMTLSDIRKARSLTQERMADLLGIRQDSVSKLEKRTDLLLSTLRSYVEAMGGELRLIVEFPDRPPVVLTGLSELEPEKAFTREVKSVHE